MLHFTVHVLLPLRDLWLIFRLWWLPWTVIAHSVPFVLIRRSLRSYATDDLYRLLLACLGWDDITNIIGSCTTFLLSITLGNGFISSHLLLEVEHVTDGGNIRNGSLMLRTVNLIALLWLNLLRFLLLSNLLLNHIWIVSKFKDLGFLFLHYLLWLLLNMCM